LDDTQAVNALVRRCVSGDAAAWQEIVQQYHRRIYNICYRFSGSSDDAADLAQEVFVKIYRTLGTFDGTRASFMTWVTTVTRNLLVDHFRKGKYDRITDSLESTSGNQEDGLTIAEQVEDQSLSPEARVQSQQVQRMVHQALLRDLQDMDYKEIAQVLRVPEGTVKSRINRGRTELGRLLERTYRQVN